MKSFGQRSNDQGYTDVAVLKECRPCKPISAETDTIISGQKFKKKTQELFKVKTNSIAFEFMSLTNFEERVVFLKYHKTIHKKVKSK